MAMIGSLREQIADALGTTISSLLLSKILYSGTHGGDVIPVSDRDRLKQEILLVRGKASLYGSAELEEFLSTMDELIAASEEHANPIVFV